MLGPYLPWYVCHDNGMNFPRFSSLILNSKSSKVRPFNQSLIEEKVQILANFFAHYLLLANFDLNYDLILPVPAKPRYAINTLNFACSEFSKVARIPSDFSVLSRISDEEKTYQLHPQSGNIIVGKRIILFDDISTSGTTENLIREILQNGGASRILLIAFGNTDHSDYSA